MKKAKSLIYQLGTKCRLIRLGRLGLLVTQLIYFTLITLKVELIDLFTRSQIMFCENPCRKLETMRRKPDLSGTIALSGECLLHMQLALGLNIGYSLVEWLASLTTDQGVPGSRPGRVAVRCGLSQSYFPPA